MVMHMNKDINVKETLFNIFKYIKPYKWLIVLNLVFSVLVVLTTLYVPILTGKIIDLFIGESKVDLNMMKYFIGVLIICISITTVLTWFNNLIINKVVYNIVLSMRSEAFNKIHKLPISYVDKHSHGDLISRIISDIDQLSEGLLLGFNQLFTGVLTILITLFYMFKLNFYISLLVIVVTPISILTASFLAKKSYLFFKEQSVNRGMITSVVDESLNDISLVKVFNMEDIMFNNFKEVNDKLKDSYFKSVFYSSIVNPATRSVNGLVYALVAVFGAFMVLNKGISIGELTAFLGYASSYTKPFNEISNVVSELQNSLACGSRLFEFLNEEEINDEFKERLNEFNTEITLNNVNFSYDNKNLVIKDFNLNVLKGKHIAIVGPTGCGKTTLINLLMRFYDVSKGDISIDNHNIKDIPYSDVRTLNKMVLQDTWLKNESVYSNISMGKDVTYEQVIKASKEAFAHSFIERLPQGYDTIISKNGDNLSNGQKQLICIARVMLFLSEILILDEATSSIDTRTEVYIQKAFDKLMEHRTSFVVAHRLSTIVNADLIVVMKDGEIIETGKHKELLSNNGFYKELYNSQFESVENTVSAC